MPFRTQPFSNNPRSGYDRRVRSSLRGSRSHHATMDVASHADPARSVSFIRRPGGPWATLPDPARPCGRWILTSSAVANHNGVVMTREPMPEDGSPLGTAREDARSRDARLIARVLGSLLCVIGTVTAIENSLHHPQSVGPYLLAAGFLLLFLAALDLRRVERTRARRATRTIRRLAARVEREEVTRRHLEHDRDQWRRMQAEEASINRRLAAEMQRVRRPRVSGGRAGAASTSPPTSPVGVGGGYSTPPSPTRAQRSRPRHQARRPADNQPALFDQEDERRL
jgi:hypothetical protein